MAWFAAWAQEPMRESAVKAAFLYRFASYVEWPAGTFARPADPLVMGVLGNDAVATELEDLVIRRQVGGRPVVVRRLRESDLQGHVHILMIGATREARLRQLAAQVQGPVLLVTEQDSGLAAGGVLNFVVDGSRVRFAASQGAAEARGLRLSSRLLAVALYVEGSF